MLTTTRFFITLDPSHLQHISAKHTIFGRLVSGEDVLDQIASIDVDDKDFRPAEPVLISRCGELERRKKPTASKPQPARVSQDYSRDRGRRQRSTDRDVEMEDSPEPRNLNKHRRQSDNVVDEGIRGRPRQRSGARSPTRSLSTQSEDSETGSATDQSSPTKVHKRKRSASPSRHANGERRRRSLPNQYRDDRFNRPREDDDRYRPSPRRDDHKYPARKRDDEPRYSGGRHDDRYRPSRERNPHADHGRLGGSSYGENDPPVKFKGRGVMKYQESETRAW